MDIDTIKTLIETVGFAGVIGGGAIWYVFKTTEKREARMWDTINGFQGVLHKFDGTLRDMSSGLKDVKEEVVNVKNTVDTVRKDVEDLKRKG